VCFSHRLQELDVEVLFDQTLERCRPGERFTLEQEPEDVQPFLDVGGARGRVERLELGVVAGSERCELYA